MSEPEVMTLIEAAEYLRISYPTIYRMVRNGSMPAVKIGGQYRVRRETVEALLDGAA